MKKIIKRVLSVALCLIMLFSAVPLAGLNLGVEAEAKSLADCAVGEIITFGSYPQSLVKDSSLKSSLDSVSKTWISYGYYSGTGSTGTMYKDSWMKYADITYGGNKYRAVTFSQYRPYYTYYQCSSSYSYQDNNGYNTNTVYYFKYEPLKWRVLDPEEGLVMCESIIDSQAYSNTIFYENGEYYNDAFCTNYANDYATSSIREWLNEDFYNTAFTTSEKNEIKKSVQDNSCPWHSEYDSGTTNDKIFLLSYDEVRNTEYGFSSDTGYDEAREAHGTDYAKCQGLWVSTSSSYYGNSYWRLRSPGDYSYYACVVDFDGYVYNYYYCYVNNTYDGVRPALKFNPKSVIFESFYSQEHTVSDYASKNAKYASEYFGGEAAALDGTNGTADLCIPGLSKSDNLVPQGIAYYEAKNWMLVSAYYKEESGNMCDVSSVIFALDMDTGEMVGEFRIKNADGSDYTEHAGGIAVSDYNLYITDKNSTISYVPLSALDSSKNEIKIEKSYSCASVLGGANTSYLSYNDGILWTGNFYEKNDFKTPASSSNNSVVLGYELSGESSDEEWYNLKNSSSWSYKFNIPNSISKIQGVSVKNNKLYLLSSYGRKNDSTLYIADVEMGSRHVSEASMIKVNALPMLEGMCLAGNYIYTLSESAAWYYNGYNSGNVSKNPTDVVWRINYKPLIGEDSSNATTGDVDNVTVKFVQGDTTGKVDVSFKQSWFSSDSVNYNHNLARLASQYIMLGYDDSTSKTNKPNLRVALQKIGMNNIVMAAEAERDQVNYFIASRKVTVNSKQYDLIFVGLIGSYHAQWYSNFDPGTGATHQGFNSAKEFVKTALKNYIENNGFSKDTTKILITGHSRGAAASNLLAADLIKNETFARKENIYTYAFATPNSTTLPERTDAKFNRIYNIVNPEDFVTKCMPAEWGYGRYGQTYVLPSKSNEKNSDYKVYKSNMQKYFSYFTGGKTYTPYPLAEADTRAVVTALTSTVRSVNQFYNKTLVAGVVPMSTYTFFQNSLCHFVSKVASTGDMVTAASLLGATLLSTSSDVYQAIVAYFFVDQIVNPCFEHAHQAETYCAYMMSMTESQLKEERAGYLNTVNCPVDVTVIDNETGEVVGKIVNNVIDEKIASKENSVVMIVDGDSKSFWLPSDGDYEVILTGNDNGTMDYTVSEVGSDAGETERVNFYDVEITDGKSYTGEIIADDFVIDEYTITSENGKVISPDEKFDDSSMQTVEINVSVSGNGYATDSMTVTKGDYVTLEATAEDGYYFDGWYEDGEFISYEETYSFVAKENMDIVAEFSDASEYLPEIICYQASINYKDSLWISPDDFLEIRDDMDYTVEYDSSDESVVYVDDDGYIFATGTGVATVTCTVTFENGYTQIIELEIDVTYSWWQWLIIIFLFGWIWY